MNDLYQYDRVYQLVIGDKNKPDEAIFIGYDYESQEDRSLQISFDISKKTDVKKGGISSAVIDIHNLPFDVMRRLQSSEHLAFEFRAGYKDTGAKLLLSGQVVQVSNKKSGTEWITTITAGEGFVELNQSKLRKGLPVGVTIEQAVEECRKLIPSLDRGIYSGVNKDRVLTDGYPLNGSAKQVLDDLCRASRIEYRVDRNALYISDESGIGTKDPEGEAYLLTQDTGLLDTPFWVQEDGTKLKKDKTRRQRLQFRCLLNANIVPASIVRIESPLITGVFKVNDCRYSGRYRNGEWVIDAYASEILLEDIPR